LLHLTTMTTPRRKTARMGRPPLGAGGEKVSEYPQVMIRLPRATKATLDALSGLTGTPIWRLIDQAVAVYVDQMPDAQRKLLAGVRERRALERRRS
jgi:predicted DNA-binding protein